MNKAVDPRIERTRAVVLETAIQIVAERGFAGASIDSISQRSGVARSTIYRHWPSRMDLLLEAVGSAVGDIESLAVGDLRRDLVAVSMHLAHMLASERIGSVAASIILESRRDPALDGPRGSWSRRECTTSRGSSMTRWPAASSGMTRIPMPWRQIWRLRSVFRALVLRAPIDQIWIEEHVDRVLRLHRDRSQGRLQARTGGACRPLARSWGCVVHHWGRSARGRCRARLRHPSVPVVGRGAGMGVLQEDLTSARSRRPRNAGTRPDLRTTGRARHRGDTFAEHRGRP